MSDSTTIFGFTRPVGGDGVSALRTSIGANADLAELLLSRLSFAALQAGVLDAGGYMVTQASGGASLNLDIASNVGSGALVRKTGTNLLGYVQPTVSKTTVTLDAAHATNPRIDGILLGIDGTVSVVKGTPTSGATLDNLTGALTVSNTLVLAYVRIPALDTTIDNTQIRDRRRWARGLNVVIPGTGGGDITTTGDDELTTFSRRIECAEGPVVIEFTGNLKTTSGQTTTVALDIDGSSVSQFFSPSVSGSAPYPVVIRHVLVSPGSHTVRLRLATSSGTGTLYNTGTQGLPCLTIRETVAASAANNTTTSG